MTDQPAPLVAKDVDVGPLDGFMLDTVRLLGSELVALSTGDEFKAAVLLWARAWKQRPAASLPNDDRTLASYAGYGNGSRVDLKGFQAVRAMAMRGFVLCSDNRWYHPVLAEDANRAWDALKKRKKWKDDKDRQRGQSGGQPGGQPQGHGEGHIYKSGADTPETDLEKTGSIDGTGRDGTGEKKEEPSLRSGPAPSKRSGTKLNTAWSPTAEDHAYARGRGFGDQQIIDIAADFRGYWTAGQGRNKTHADWHLAWQTWVRKERVRPATVAALHGAPKAGDRDRMLASRARFDAWAKPWPSEPQYQPPPTDADRVSAAAAYRDHVVAWAAKRVAWNAALYGERKPDDAEVAAAELGDIPDHLRRQAS